MNTSPLYRTLLSWSQTKGTLDRVCTGLGLDWYYDPVSYRIVFKRRGVADTMIHDLEECFGDPANLEFVVGKPVLMRMDELSIRNMLEWWLSGKPSLTWTTTPGIMIG